MPLRQLDNRALDNLYLHDDGEPGAGGTRALVVGEVLWDLFPDSERLGGAALNFAVHLKRLRHDPRLLSAVGDDARGKKAAAAIVTLGLDTSLLQSTDRYTTGSATVRVGPGDDTSFTIERPAAYDAVELPEAAVTKIVRWNPAWIYFGTLFPSGIQPRRVLDRLLDVVPDAARFYDLNLRPGFESPALVDELLRTADVVKANERELRFLHQHLNLPADPEGFCRAGSERYTWRAACVTLGARGCALFLDGNYVEAPGCPVDVADPVGAGDAFAAAFVHGIVSHWPAIRVAGFANHVGAQAVGARGAIPDASPRSVSRV